MKDEILARVARATVQVLKKGGQGVVVPGGFVLTAAHCIDWSPEGAMVLGDYYLERIKTADGVELILSPCCVEAVADIAVLAAPDRQEFYKEATRVEEFLDSVEPTPVSMDEYQFMEKFRVFVRSHKGKWIPGEAQHCSADKQSQSLFIETEEHIHGGTSGGPIVNERGELVAIVSNFGGTADESNEHDKFATKQGVAPRPHLTLPLWVWNEIRRAMCQQDE